MNKNPINFLLQLFLLSLPFILLITLIFLHFDPDIAYVFSVIMYSLVLYFFKGMVEPNHVLSQTNVISAFFLFMLMVIGYVFFSEGGFKNIQETVNTYLPAIFILGPVILIPFALIFIDSRKKKVK